ncbi:MAG: FkbM family methyltransferase [Dehalococcoidia bacterium]
MAISPFDTIEAVRIHEARKASLDAMLSPLLEREQLRTALDCGTGFGYFARYLHDKGLEVTAFDVRPENIETAKRRHAGIRFLVGNIEDPSITQLGSFDVVVCFGLIYHLENPFLAIRHLYALTGRYLFLEGQVAPFPVPGALLMRETSAIDQSLRFVALMPSEQGLVHMLYYAGFSNVYRPDALPDHPDFRSSIGRKRVRTMLVACKGALDLPGLTRLPEPPSDHPYPWFRPLGLKRLGRKGLTALERKLPPQLVYWLCARAYKSRPLHLYPGWPASPSLYKRVLWRFYLAHPRQPLVVPWHKGTRVILYPDNSIYRSLFYGRLYEPNEMAFLESTLKQGGVFVDVGANIGLYSLFASRLVGESGVVLALEPSEREFHRLQENIVLNRAQNIRARRVAASNEIGAVSLMVASGETPGLNSLGPFGLEGTVLDHVETVPAKPLDTLVEEESLQRVDFIKIDVEGAELKVLQGAQGVLHRFRPTLLVELQDRTLRMQGATAQQVWDFLVDRGYRILRFDQGTGQPTPVETYQDFAVRPSVNIVALPMR